MIPKIEELKELRQSRKEENRIEVFKLVAEKLVEAASKGKYGVEIEDDEIIPFHFDICVSLKASGYRVTQSANSICVSGW